MTNVVASIIGALPISENIISYELRQMSIHNAIITKTSKKIIHTFSWLIKDSFSFCFVYDCKYISYVSRRLGLDKTIPAFRCYKNRPTFFITWILKYSLFP